MPWRSAQGNRACGGEPCAWEGQLEESEEIDVVAPQRRYAIDCAINVEVSKYLDHLPLERQVRMMRHAGWEVTSQMLWDQIDLLTRLVGKVPERLLVGVVGEQRRCGGTPDVRARTSFATTSTRGHKGPRPPNESGAPAATNTPSVKRRPWSGIRLRNRDPIGADTQGAGCARWWR